MTPDEALAQFLAQWDTKKADGVVEWDEFLEYYDSVSCSIDDDDYFELMMRNAWHLPGGTGWCENVSDGWGGGGGRGFARARPSHRSDSAPDDRGRLVTHPTPCPPADRQPPGAGHPR